MNASTTIPPPILDDARVLAYAVIDDSVTYTGRSTLYVDGQLLGSVARLAICKNLRNEDILLFFCNDQWKSLGVTNHSSLKDAQARAEREYRGVSEKWIELKVSDEEIMRYLEQHSEVRCSFCGKRPIEIEKMFRSHSACICNECVAALFQELEHSKVG